MPYILSLITLAVMIYALIDIITRRDDQVKYLPKMVWLIVVILLPFIGSVLWFALGREYENSGVMARRMRRTADAGGWAPPAMPADTRSTEQQLADLEREIEEERLREEIAKRRRQERSDSGTE